MDKYTTDQGLRHYIVNDERHYPSVTTILSATDSWAERKTLENWGKRNPGGKERAAERGTAIHKWCERYLLNREILAPSDPEQASYISQSLVNVLDRMSIVKPLWVEHSLFTPHAFVWNDEWGYAGAPDWVGRYYHPKLGPVMMMVDLKTSQHPYSRHYPLKGAPDYHKRRTGAKKYEKVCMQLMAYAHAFEKTVGIMPTMQMAVVAQPGNFNHYILTTAEKQKAWDEFRRRCDLFYSRYCKSTRTYDFPTEEEEKAQEDIVTVTAG